MKITLSKQQWELIGKKAGWIKESARPFSDYPGAGDVGGYPGIPYSEYPESNEVEVVLLSPSEEYLLKINNSGFLRMFVSRNEAGEIESTSDWQDANSDFEWDDTIRNPSSGRYEPLLKDDVRHGLTQRDYSSIDSLSAALELKGFKPMEHDNTGYGCDLKWLKS